MGGGRNVSSLSNKTIVLDGDTTRICDLPTRTRVVKKKKPKNPTGFRYRIGSLPMNTIYEDDSNAKGQGYRICDLPIDEDDV